MALCGLVGRSKCFGEAWCCLHLQGWSMSWDFEGPYIYIYGGRRGSLKERVNQDEWGRDWAGPMRRLQVGIRRGEFRADELSPFQGLLGRVNSLVLNPRSFKLRMWGLKEQQRQSHTKELTLHSGPCKGLTPSVLPFSILVSSDAYLGVPLLVQLSLCLVHSDWPLSFRLPLLPPYTYIWSVTVLAHHFSPEDGDSTFLWNVGFC
jgi:hypothetical protein